MANKGFPARPGLAERPASTRSEIFSSIYRVINYSNSAAGEAMTGEQWPLRSQIKLERDRRKSYVARHRNSKCSRTRPEPRQSFLQQFYCLLLILIESPPGTVAVRREARAAASAAPDTARNFHSVHTERQSFKRRYARPAPETHFSASRIGGSERANGMDDHIVMSI